LLAAVAQSAASGGSAVAIPSQTVLSNGMVSA